MTDKINNDVSLRQAYFHMLVKKFPVWMKKKLPICEAVEKHTNEYLDSHDVIKNWVTDTFMWTGNQEDVMTHDGVFEIFKTERKSLPPAISNLNRVGLIHELIHKNRLGHTNEFDRWTGWRPKNAGHAHQMDLLSRQPAVRKN